MYKASGVAKIFNVSSMTIKRWADEYAIYLSGSVATPGGYRRFNPDDIAVLALIAEFRNAGKTNEELHAALESGQRGIVPKQPPRETSNADTQETDFNKRIYELETQLELERSARLRAEGQVELLEKQVEKPQERLFRREW